MPRHIARRWTLALTLMLLIAPAGRAFADDCTTDPNSSCVVTGTNPDPQVNSGAAPVPKRGTLPTPAPQIVIGDLSLIAMLAMA
jgi:hypothetical protein